MVEGKRSICRSWMCRVLESAQVQGWILWWVIPRLSTTQNSSAAGKEMSVFEGQGRPWCPRWMVKPSSWRVTGWKNCPFHFSMKWNGECVWQDRMQYWQSCGWAKQWTQRYFAGLALQKWHVEESLPLFSKSTERYRSLCGNHWSKRVLLDWMVAQLSCRRLLDKKGRLTWPICCFLVPDLWGGELSGMSYWSKMCWGGRNCPWEDERWAENDTSSGTLGAGTALRLWPPSWFSWVCIQLPVQTHYWPFCWMW